MPSLGCRLWASQQHLAASLFQHLPKEWSLPFPRYKPYISSNQGANIMYANCTSVIKTAKEKKKRKVTKVKIVRSWSPVRVHSVLPPAVVHRALPPGPWGRRRGPERSPEKRASVCLFKRNELCLSSHVLYSEKTSLSTLCLKTNICI